MSEIFDIKGGRYAREVLPSRADTEFDRVRDGWFFADRGFFFEYVLGDREEFFRVVTEKFQTIAQFGINVGELRQQIVERGLRGIDRIVPIGQAMNIGVIWDGYDLIRTLSRVVDA